MPDIFRPSSRPKDTELLQKEATNNLSRSIANEIGLGFQLHVLEFAVNVAKRNYSLVARVSIELPDGVHTPTLEVGEAASMAGIDINDVISYRFDEVRAAIIDATYKYLWSENRRPV